MNWYAVAVSTIAFIGMVKWKWDIIPVAPGADLMGLIYRTVQ